MHRTQLFGAALVAALTGAIVSACGSDETVGFPDGDGGEGGGVLGNPDFEPAPGGIRRLLASQYVRSVRHLLGDGAAQAATPPTDFPVDGFDAIGAATVAVPTSGPETYEQSALEIAEATIADPSRLAVFAPCVDSTPNAACYEEVAEDFARLAWRRSLTADEVDTLTSIATAAQAWDDGSFETGLKYELMAILQSPSFLYLVEVGEPTDDGERLQLTATELATRMSFFLTGRTPDVELLDAAERGELDDEDDIRAHARRLLESGDARDALDDFYSEVLFLRDIQTLSKDADEYPTFSPELGDAMKEETLLLIQDIVWERDGDAREIFGADYSFINAELAELYGVDAPSGSGFEKVTLPADHNRAGFLGQAAFLARFAHPVKTSPTRRGKFILNNVLCESVPPPPPDVIVELPEDNGEPQTMKQRLEQHYEDPACAGCHYDMDNIGFALENYDAIGQFRTKEDGLPIDPTSNVSHLGDFASARELAEILYEDERMAACFVKNFIRSSMGHRDTDGEAPAIDALRASFAEGGYSLQDLMVELTVSPAFRMVSDPK